MTQSEVRTWREAATRGSNADAPTRTGADHLNHDSAAHAQKIGQTRDGFVLALRRWRSWVVSCAHQAGVLGQRPQVAGAARWRVPVRAPVVCPAMRRLGRGGWDRDSGWSVRASPGRAFGQAAGGGHNDGAAGAGACAVTLCDRPSTCARRASPPIYAASPYLRDGVSAAPKGSFGTLWVAIPWPVRPPTARRTRRIRLATTRRRERRRDCGT